MFGISTVKAGLSNIGHIFVSLNQTVANMAGLSTNMNRASTVATKVGGGAAGTLMLVKGSVDVYEAVVCQDSVCAIISDVGCFADILQFCTSFIPGAANVTVVLTFSVSTGCKVFLECCKRSKIPWLMKGCR